MASPVAIIGLSYRGTDLQTMPPGIFMEITAGLFDGLEVIGQDQPLLGADGVFPRPRRIRRRKVTLVGIIGPDDGTPTRASWIDNIETAEALFDPHLYGDLVATLPNATTRTLEVRPEAAPLITFEQDLQATISVVLLSRTTPAWTPGP
jgi:hypothetical protein